MKLFQADYYLESGRLGMARYAAAKEAGNHGVDQENLERVREYLDKGKKLVAETGYHRRDGEVAELEGMLAEVKG
ncbi:MAG: hypothetical protein HQK60_11005 [Deltaproteobacteria bacterium]|nr:hypothetical protein [Deltaproteobacteria bacterium]